MKEIEIGFVINSIMNVNYKQYGVSSASIKEVDEMKKIFQEQLRDYNITDSVTCEFFDLSNDEYRVKENLHFSDVNDYYKYVFLQGNGQLKLLWNEEFVYNQLLEIRQKSMSYFTPTDLEGIINKIVQNPEKFYQKIAAELSIDEYRFIQGMLDNKNCDSCRNQYCNGVNSDDGCTEYVNPVRVGKAKIFLKG